MHSDWLPTQFEAVLFIGAVGLMIGGVVLIGYF